MSSSSHRSSLLPILASLALAAGIGWAVYTLAAAPADPSPEKTAALSAEVAENAQRNAEREKEKAALEALLAEEPCVVAKKLGIEPKLAPSSTPVARPAEPKSTPPAGTGAQTSGLEKVEDATVMVLNLQKNGDVMLGTGFFVAPGLVVSNEHVAGGDTSRILVSNAYLGGVAEAELVSKDSTNGRDYALLRVRNAKAQTAPSLALRLDAKRTEKVSAWGYPSAVSKSDPKYQALLDGNIKAVPEIIYSEGAISAVLDRKPPLIAHTTPLSPGNSGGPLVDASGNVVGINTLISLDEESYRQTSLSLAARDLAQFLRSAGVNVRLAEAGEGTKP